MSSILTVTQLNNILSAKIKTEPKFRGLAIKGEISNFSVSSQSGHAYFYLRDFECGIKAVIFANNAAKLRFSPFDGMSVIAYGNVDFYNRDGTCEIIVSQLLPDGAGAEYLALQKLKEKLSALGIFDAPKKPIPRYPKKIAVVTSPTGAAISDVKNIISRRYPVVELVLFPTLVQGADAPMSIVSALQKADKSDADTIILTRGGGSSEDLSAFNAEAVVMAVASCQTPVISAVGHEIDWSLCDLAADLRAPTPSGAAELATPDIAEMRREISSLGAILNHTVNARISAFRDRLKSYEYALSSLSVKSKISERKAELKALGETLERQTNHRIELAYMNLNALSEMLESLDPRNVISRGYAMIYKDGEVAADAKNFAAGDNITIMMRGGSADAEVKNITVGDKNEL